MSLEEAIREAVVWGRVGGKRETENTRVAMATVDRNGAFECTLLEGEYNVNLMLGVDQDGGTAEGVRSARMFRPVASDIAIVSTPAEGETIVDLGELNTTLVPVSDPAFSDVVSRDARENYGGAPQVDSLGTASDDSFGEPAAFAEDIGPPGPSRQRFHKRVPDTSSGLPAWNPRQPATTPVDQSIARLVTDLLAAGDRRTRENMRSPLQELLQKKFDAEQNAREALVKQLRERLEEASRQVVERKQQRDRIVREQLDRMMSLPEDDFLPMAPVPQPAESDASTESDESGIDILPTGPFGTDGVGNRS